MTYLSKINVIFILSIHFYEVFPSNISYFYISGLRPKSWLVQVVTSYKNKIAIQYIFLMEGKKLFLTVN